MSRAHLLHVESLCNMLRRVFKGDLQWISLSTELCNGHMCHMCLCDFCNRWRDTTTHTLPAFCCSLFTGPSVTQSPSNSEFASWGLYWKPSMQHSMNSMLFWVRVPVLSVKTYSTCRQCDKNTWQALPSHKNSIAHLTAPNKTMRQLFLKNITTLISLMNHSNLNNHLANQVRLIYTSTVRSYMCYQKNRGVQKKSEIQEEQIEKKHKNMNNNWTTASMCLTCPSSSLRSEVLTSAPSLISGSKKSLSHAIKKDPKNFCISTVTYMETGMMKLKSTMKDRKSVNTVRYWWRRRDHRHIFLRVLSWTK